MLNGRDGGDLWEGLLLPLTPYSMCGLKPNLYPLGSLLLLYGDMVVLHQALQT